MKRILVFVLVIMICTLVGCSNTEEPPETVKESAVNEVETFGVKWSEEKFSFMDNEDIIWYTGEYIGRDDVKLEYGKVSYDETYRLLYEDNYDNLEDDVLYPVELYVISKKNDQKYVYDNYIKSLNVRTELEGFDEEAKEKVWNVPVVPLLIFLEKQQIKDIVAAGCPNDMKVLLCWAYKYHMPSVLTAMSKEKQLIGFGGQTNWQDADIINGKVTYDDTLSRVMVEGGELEENQVFVIRMKERTGKTESEFYYNYVKNLNVSNEFSQMSDEEIKTLFGKLDQEKIYESPLGKEVTVIIVFLTNSELNRILEAGCPEDMAVSLELYNAGEINMRCGEVIAKRAK